MNKIKTVTQTNNDLTQIQKLQQVKIEELTLYIIQQQKQIEELIKKLKD